MSARVTGRLPGPSLTPLAAAQRYTELGLFVIDVPHARKGPRESEWQNRRLTAFDLPERFTSATNIGIILGEASRLMDVDIDSPEAVDLAPFFLPPTDMAHGRKSIPVSHCWYRPREGSIRTTQFVDPTLGPSDEGRMLVELRGDGGQTLVPPSIHPDGEAYEWAADGEPGVCAIEALHLSVRRLASAALLLRYWPALGVRHHTRLALAGALLSNDWPQDEVENFIYAISSKGGTCTQAQVSNAVGTTTKRLREGLPATGLPTLAEIVPPTVVAKLTEWLGLRSHSFAPAAGRGVNLTDLGNGERLASRFGNDLRYCWETHTWLSWDGRRWLKDEGAKVQALAKQTVRSIYDEAARESDADRRGALAKWARASESERHVGAMMNLARSEPGIPVDLDALDTDPFTLTVLNGTVDLRTGVLRSHERGDLITKIAPIIYDPDARLPLWDRFLETIFPDAQTRNYVQRSAGYSLLGLPEQDRIFFGYGPSRSGKTTFIEAIASAAGEYAMHSNTDALAARSHPGGPRPEIARLAGARLVVASEVEKGQRLALALIKTLAGGDKIAARHLYKGEFEFRPTFTIWVVGNDRLLVPDNDEAVWERLREVPFRVVIPREERDPAVKQQLRRPDVGGPAVLAWLVEGCLAYLRDGLGEPPEVAAATDDFRSDMDPLNRFLGDCCRLTGWAFAAQLRAAYEKYCKEEGGIPVGDREWGDRLRAHGARSVKKGRDSARAWDGISLVSERSEGSS